jgi:adenine nucleotide transporter 17
MQAMNVTFASSSADVNASDLSMIQLTMDLYYRYGITAFVRGIEISALQSALEKGLYFLSYTLLKKLHRFLSKTTTTSKNSYLYLLYGYFSGWVHLPLTLPLDAWKTQVQSSQSPSGIFNISMLAHMIQDPSFQFYKGISTYTVLCMTPAIQYWIYEQLKILLLRKKQNLASNNATSLQQMTILETFILGMISRTVSTLLVYPCIRRKVLLQTMHQTSKEPSLPRKEPMLLVDPSNENKANASVQTPYEWKRVVESIKQLYYGIGPELTRGILSASIMLMMKEHISSLVRRNSK